MTVLTGWLRWWNTLRRWLSKLPGKQLPTPTTLALPAPSASAPAPTPIAEVVWLEQLTKGNVTESHENDIASDLFFRKIEDLWMQGHELLAIEWLEKFTLSTLVPPDKKDPIRYKLAELCERRGDLGLAVPHLERLCENKLYAKHAHYQLGEHYRSQGQYQKSLRHYEAVLARDFDYLNTHARIHRLRSARGQARRAQVGDTLVGPSAAGTSEGARYQLVRELGRGATAVVYHAKDTQLHMDVAVKLLHPHLAASHRKLACTRFFQEARVAASLRHPHILAILDVDEKARRIVMELATGGTLRAHLHDQGPCCAASAIELHLQILSALDAAHRSGVVHRDLKPGNLIFRRAPNLRASTLVLGDFGVAHLPTEGSSLQNHPEQAVGTVAYMAPEQRHGAQAAPSADIYSASIVLFETLVGRKPWDREQILSGQRGPNDLQLPPGTAPAHLESELQEYLYRLSNPSPNKRPTTQQALQEATSLRDAL